MLSVEARAQDRVPGALTCAAGAPTLEAALALSVADLDCGAGRFRNRSHFVRTHTDFQGRPPIGENLVWQTDPTTFDSILLRATYSDGHTAVIDVDPQMAVRNWAAPLRFSVPLPAQAKGRTLRTLDAVIERPGMLAVIRNQQVVETAQARRNHFRASLLHAVAIAMLIVPIFYTGLFFRLLRAPFMLWHAGMAATMALFIACNSGLIFVLFPNMPLLLRWQMGTVAVSVSAVCAAFFTLGLLEDERIRRRWHRPTLAAAFVLLGAMGLGVAFPYALRVTVVWYMGLAFLPLIAVVPLILKDALTHGSRAAIYAAVAFGVLITTALVKMADTVNLISLAPLPDDLLLLGMIVMTIASSAGVADRFMVMRVQLDRERQKTAALNTLAYTDGLTGLANRRAFDAQPLLDAGEGLIVADLDHFKAINDRHGHRAGDEALARFAYVLRRCVARMDGSRVFRLGGEEFAVVLHARDRAALAQAAETIRRTIADDASSRFRLTVSIGATLAKGPPLPGGGHEGEPIGDAYARADRAMYRAKTEGRDRCCLADEAVTEFDYAMRARSARA